MCTPSDCGTKSGKSLAMSGGKGAHSPQYVQYVQYVQYELRVRPLEQTPGLSQDCNHFQGSHGWAVGAFQRSVRVKNVSGGAVSGRKGAHYSQYALCVQPLDQTSEGWRLDSLHIPHSIQHSTFHIPHSTFHIPHSTFHFPLSTFHFPLSHFHIPLSMHYMSPHATHHIPHATCHIPFQFHRGATRNTEWVPWNRVENVSRTVSGGKEAHFLQHSGTCEAENFCIIRSKQKQKVNVHSFRRTQAPPHTAYRSLQKQLWY
jgi:hypothetical protein